MLQKKRNNFINIIRKNHHESIKNIIRKSLLNTEQQQKIEQHIELTHLAQLSELTNSQQQTLKQDNQADLKRKHQLVIQLIKKWESLIQGQHHLGNQQNLNEVNLVNLLNQLKLIILNGKNVVKFQFVGQIFCYIKSKIQFWMHALGCQRQINDIEFDRKELLSLSNLLDLTLITLISEYLNQGGIISQNLVAKNWLIRQFFNWIQSFDIELTILIESQENNNQNSFKQHILILQCYLFQLSKIVQIMQYYSKNDQSQQLILCLFSKKITKKMITLIRSYHTPLSIQICITNIFYQVGQLKNYTFHENLIVNQFLQFARLHLFIYDQYKTYSSKTSSLSAQIVQQIEIITNILYILSQITANYSSDLVWSSGIAPQVKYILPQIQNLSLRQDFITFLLSSIVSIHQSSTIKLVNQNGMMGWVLSILESKISYIRQSDLQISHSDNTLIRDCMITLRFFFHLGKYQMENSNELNLNPYLILFKYLRGYQIINHFKEGQQLLNEIKQFISL